MLFGFLAAVLIWDVWWLILNALSVKTRQRSTICAQISLYFTINYLKGFVFCMNTDAKSTDVSEGILGNQIIQYFAYFEENSLKGIAKKCSRLMINDNFGMICLEDYAEPSFEEMKELVLEELRGNFDEKVAVAIARACPYLSDDQADTELIRLEKLYRKEHEEQIRATTLAAIKDLKMQVKNLQREVKSLRRKYTV